MEWVDFQISVPGKWVLSGEHSVLKGAKAIALPRLDVELTLSFLKSDSETSLFIDPPQIEALIRDLIYSVAKSRSSENKSFVQPQGKLKITSTIPIGAGLGSSAALCVAMTRWMAGPLEIPHSEWIQYATQMEHLFHGKSSGMDVAVICAGEAISYDFSAGIKPLGVTRLPKFTFHDTQLRSRTSDCVRQVELFRDQNESLGRQVDQAMSHASCLAIEGLNQYDSGDTIQGLSIISRAIQQARECFYTWKLVPEPVRQLEELLLKQGALATKLTGAGGGGMLVALWPEDSFRE